MKLKYINNYFLILFSLIPISLILGSTISLINIFLIDISFLFFLFYLKDFSFFKNRSFQYLLILYIYLIFNSFISVDQSIGISRNLGFIRIIIFFLAMNYFFKEQKFLDKVLYIWGMIITVVIIDVFIESFTGKNTLGFGELYGRRIVSFFKDEPIVGGYLNAFYLFVIGFLYYKFGKNNKNLITIFSILIFISILLTGERSNSIKALLGIFIFFVFLKEYQIKYRLFSIFGGMLVLITIIFSSDYLKFRYVDQIQKNIQNKLIDNYLIHYKSGYKIFQENMYFGVGNKNYRIVACSKFQEKAKAIIAEYGVPSDKLGSSGEKADKLMSEIEYVCSTHAHQIYFELLSEHGIFGSIIIIYLVYKLILSNLLFRFSELNYIQIGAGIYISLIFLPLIPSGSFFTDFSITLFALNLSIFYASNSKFNIFLNTKIDKLDN